MRTALLALSLLAPTSATAALTQAQLAEVGATPSAGALLPAGLSFVDQDGRPYRLVDTALPTVLLFADYTCRHICGPGVTLTAGALHDAALVPGRDYRMIVIGMDQDGPVLARALIAKQRKGLPAEAGAMRLLTGDRATVAQAEKTLGYHAVYDAQADQFAHDTAIYIFAPDGRLSALLPETASTAPQLAAAIAGAKRGAPFAAKPKKQATFLGRVSAICYGLASASGLYARPIVVGLRVGGVAICLALAGFLLWSFGRRRREGEA